MPYYGMRGDYYRGDYYGRGDPGFLGFLGKMVSTAGAFIPGVGGIAAKVGGLLGKAGQTPAGAIAISPARKLGQVAGSVVRTVGSHPVISAAGGAAVAGLAGAAVEHRMAGGAGAQRGFHVSRKTGKVVRNRHMRVTNPKALRRSLRRVAGFARMARRVLHFTHPRASRGAAHFRFPKRRRKAA